MKYLVFIIMIIAVSAGYSALGEMKLERGFNLSGKVEVSERLLKAATADNMSCSIIVRNEADMPIAIKRVINPSFPLGFKFSNKDLLLDSYEGSMKLEVYISSHGKLGVVEKGDILGESQSHYVNGQKNILLTANKSMGVPTLTPGRRGNFFRTAAR
jgi:hypothetical protein